VYLFRWGLWIAIIACAVLIAATLGIVGIASFALAIGIIAMIVGYAKTRR
jgi:hypothetical protein